MFVTKVLPAAHLKRNKQIFIKSICFINVIKNLSEMRKAMHKNMHSLLFMAFIRNALHICFNHSSFTWQQ